MESSGPAALIFTSPGDGDAKTEPFVSLVAALAEPAAQRVSLLDANLQETDLAACLGIEAVQGLAHVLAGAASWQQVVQATAVPHLNLLPGVKPPVADPGLPCAANLRPLLAELRSCYRLVVDAASLGPAEAAPVAGCCDGAYPVVRLRHTTRRDLVRAAQVIGGCQGHLWGSVTVGGWPVLLTAVCHCLT